MFKVLNDNLGSLLIRIYTIVGNEFLINRFYLTLVKFSELFVMIIIYYQRLSRRF
jgi:hypothetical protein